MQSDDAPLYEHPLAAPVTVLGLVLLATTLLFLVLWLWNRAALRACIAVQGQCENKPGPSYLEMMDQPDFPLFQELIKASLK